MLDKTYEVCLHIGPVDTDVEEALKSTMKLMDVTPQEYTPEGVVAALESSGIKPADLRTRVVVYINESVSFPRALAVYSALIGYSYSRLDVLYAGSLLFKADEPYRMAQQYPNAGAPTEPIIAAQVGLERDDMIFINPEEDIDAEKATIIKYARSLRYVETGDFLLSFNQYMLLAGLRRREKTGDRFPDLVSGDEPLPTEEAPRVGLVLDDFRRAAAAYRSTQKYDNRSAVVPRIEPNELTQALIRAAAANIEETMSRLGARQNEETSLWHCPRPDRHTNGDANASMQAQEDNTIQCYRCDSEPIDSLRLVADVKGVSAHEAAEWILKQSLRGI